MSNSKPPQMVGVRLSEAYIDRIKLCVADGGYFNQSEWLRVAIRDRLTIDEAKLRITDEK